MIPKTLFFAKKESHAQDILKAIEKVFKEEFPDKKLPEHFAQLITCKSGNSNQLISDFRNNKDFRIAITVTLVATGTDVRPLEILVFMRDINSEVLYTQMKGRGCRTIADDKLRNVTTNANSKDCYYLVDAVGVTEHEKSMPTPGKGPGKSVLSLKDLLEHLAHGEVPDENLSLLAGYLSNVNKKAEAEDLIELNELLGSITVKQLAMNIYDAIAPETYKLPEYKDINNENKERKILISALINNLKARKKLLEINAGFIKIALEKTDTLVSAGFSKEQAKQYIDTFEKYLDNTCSILNKKHYLSENDFLAAYLSFKDEQGNTVYLSNAVRDIYAETHKQTGFMGTLVDDLSDALDEKLSDNINEKVIPMIEKFVTTLSDKLDMLKTSIQSPAEDMTHTIVDKLRASMNDMMEKFGTELSGSATSNLTSLTDNLAKASDSLSDLPVQMKNMSEQLAGAFGGIHTTIEDLESAVKKIVEQSANSNKDLVERAASQYSRMEESHQQISSQTDVLIANFNDMVDTLNTTVKEVQGSMLQIKETKNALGSLVVSL